MNNTDYLIEHSDMSNEAYHAHGSQYISSSFIKNVAAHSVAKALQPLDASKQALEFGDAFHTLMESSEAFHDRFTVFDDEEIVNEILSTPKPDGTYYSNARMTGKYKAWKQDNYGDLDDADIISQSDYETLVAMKNNVLNNVHVKSWLAFNESKKAEHSYFTTQEDEYGLMYRVRPDLLIDDHIILDWKTTGDASYKGFKKSFYSFGYDIQAVFYAHVLGLDPRMFHFVCVEKTKPYAVGVYALSDDTIDNAQAKMRMALKRIAQWKENPAMDSIENSNEITYL